MVMVVAAVAMGAALLLRAPGLRDAKGGAVAFPPPFQAEIAARVLAAHAKDSGASASLAAGFVAQIAALEAAEDAGEQDAQGKARAVAGAAPKVAANLGPDGWRGITSMLAMQAVGKLEAQPAGAFFERVLRPTGVLDAQGKGLGEGWQALAQVLHRVRVLRMAMSPKDNPENMPLSDDEKQLYYRWKIERATRSLRTARLTALRRLILIDPAYPAAEAEMHIIRGK